jgi:hypothetical protein
VVVDGEPRGDAGDQQAGDQEADQRGQLEPARPPAQQGRQEDDGAELED